MYESFNPTLVRLKVSRISIGAPILWMFQSHTGSIKSLGKQWKFLGSFEFQSHTGSIKSRKYFSLISASI